MAEEALLPAGDLLPRAPGQGPSPPWARPSPAPAEHRRLARLMSPGVGVMPVRTLDAAACAINVVAAEERRKHGLLWRFLDGWKRGREK